MPAGVPWSTYIKFLCAASFSMFVGAQIVHSVYRPLDDLDALVQKEIEQIKKENRMPGSEISIVNSKK